MIVVCALMLKLDSQGWGVAGAGIVCGFGLRGHCTAPHFPALAFLVYKLSTAAVLLGVVAEGAQVP